MSAYPIPTHCLYCGTSVVLVSNKEIYGRAYTKGRTKNSNIYLCRRCGASVGTHPNGTTPLGRMAGKELQMLKKEAHALFDPIWKTRRMYRGQAYIWLANQLGIDVGECHFGYFDKPTLKRAIAILSQYHAEQGVSASEQTSNDMLDV